QNMYNNGYTTSNYNTTYSSFNNQPSLNSSTINRNNREPINIDNQNTFGNSENKAEALLSVLPDNIKEGLDVKIDYELNSFYVLGTSTKIERFKKFVQQIDKPVPVILIEVMLIEVSRNSTVEIGVNWGIGDEPTETTGGIFPKTDLTLGA